MNKEINYENLMEELNQPNYYKENNNISNNKFLGKKRVNQNFKNDNENQEKNYYENFENRFVANKNNTNTNTNKNKNSEYEFISNYDNSKFLKNLINFLNKFFNFI